MLVLLPTTAHTLPAHVLLHPTHLYVVVDVVVVVIVVAVGQGVVSR